MGNEQVTYHVIDLQPLEWKIVNHETPNNPGGQMGGPMILSGLVPIELESNFTLQVSLV